MYKGVVDATEFLMVLIYSLQHYSPEKYFKLSIAQKRCSLNHEIKPTSVRTNNMLKSFNLHHRWVKKQKKSSLN
jgi:hypothetical protein